MVPTIFIMALVGIACFVEKEQRDSSSINVLPLIIEHEVPIDLGGIGEFLRQLDNAIQFIMLACDFSLHMFHISV
ncbi:hypothetical protein V6N11_007504 [Hibiscus sabdariffa]|uniref:Uncharacterized protein n=2 Tax=Hibiscus sabdariffa TaxID=183260 RepID=A0ABR2CBU9_9ROSI